MILGENYGERKFVDRKLRIENCANHFQMSFNYFRID
ncbi:MAG: hypothetical protein US67_C0025G0011 [Candidatus Woesebacteria bacterium GW2011_GWD1_38_10]|uniref:Uncharacterized protein n=1 Tax=Candidatus Woesebacteria bacterium GW2011_GWD1_38_10 TaxID=1618592 RepID=A0A0G0ICL9_9BACT|nr:MAG: hypothetical protein US67_C0025G0011 [Candidatus Woesebacteria bacterium GW2011_GWD1_38_10]